MQTVERHFTMRRACAAAGITRRQGLAWCEEPEFADELFLAQETFLDALEEALIAAAVGRGGRVLRSSMQALTSFLATRHSDYSRHKIDLVSRQTTPIMDAIEAIVREHCPPEVQVEIREQFRRMATLYELSGGVETK